MTRSVSTTHKVGDDKSLTVARLPQAVMDEDRAVEFLEHQRWGRDPYCPRCGDFNVSQMRGKDGQRNKRYLWRCHGCREQYTVRIGTVMEDSRIPFRFWCHAFWRACASKKGVSALQIKRETGLSYKSALFLMHRVRWAMTDSAPGKLGGAVEIDETYVGGKRRLGKPGMGDNKVPVLAMVERGGNVHAMPLERVNSVNLKAAVYEHVGKASCIITDEHPSYPAIAANYDHGHTTVNHSIGEYVRGYAYTNTVEGFFSLLKRGLNGTFHSVSKRHLHRYVTEFEFRYNNRKVEDGERTRLAIKGAEGKRLRYKV